VVVVGVHLEVVVVGSGDQVEEGVHLAAEKRERDVRFRKSGSELRKKRLTRG